MQAESHGDLTAQRSDSRRWNRIYAGLLRLAAKPMCILTFSKFETAAAAAQNNCNALPLVHGEQLRIQLCIIQSLPRSDNREGCRARNVLAFFYVKVLDRLDAAHLASILTCNHTTINPTN